MRMWYVTIAMSLGTSAGIVQSVSKMVEVEEMVAEAEVVVVIQDVGGATLGRMHGKEFHLQQVSLRQRSLDCTHSIGAQLADIGQQLMALLVTQGQEHLGQRQLPINLQPMQSEPLRLPTFRLRFHLLTTLVSLTTAPGSPITTIRNPSNSHLFSSQSRHGLNGS